jgi:adenosine deaminase
MIEIAHQLGLKLPSSIDEQKKFFLLTHPLENLGMALGKFRMAQTLLHSRDVLERLSFETVTESANENTKLLELRYSPTFVQDGHPNLSWDDIHSAFLSGIQRAQKSSAIAVGLIIIVQRTLSLMTANSIVDFAINHKDSVIGIDLADNEDGYEAKIFEPIFQRAKSAGLHITVHAGEVPTSQSVLNVEESILRLGAERIGHGIQAIKSPQVIKLLLEKKIPLEVCPTSNYLTQAVPKLVQHPLRALYNEGIAITISTDDPGIFDYTLTQELEMIQTTLGFTRNDVFIFQQNAFKHSFIAESEKLKYRNFFEVQ